MMSLKHILRSALLSTLLVPGMAIAYMSPEEVLYSDENARFYTLPPNQRQTNERVAQQQSSNALLREKEQEPLFPKASSSSSEAVHSAATSDEQLQALINALAGLQQSSASSSRSSLTQEELRNQRILERIQEDREAAHNAAGGSNLPSKQSLHGGAPLSDTGPATYIAIALLAAAAGWTMYKATRLEEDEQFVE